MLQWQSLLGRMDLKITCADSVLMLNRLLQAQIPLENVVHRNDLELEITINRADYPMVLDLGEKTDATVKILYQKGLVLWGKALLHRPVLVAAILLFLFASSFLPTRILFISVQGNETVPTRQILEAANTCGIRFGAVSRQVRSEVMKNSLLELIPQLQWAGINTSGCTAVIAVREKTTTDMIDTTQNQVCSIVASRDGIIQDCTVYSGNPLCTVGQAVKTGQTLVSGYLDCGIITKATRADAEIKALTFRKLTLVAPKPFAYRVSTQSSTKRYGIRIGKKLIKFYKDSGNSHMVCGKIYKEEYIHLPGGFQLPVSIIQETLVHYEEISPTLQSTVNTEWLAESANTYLLSVMPGGQIVSEQFQLVTGDNLSLYGEYACIELIGQVKYEQTILKDEMND